MSRKLMARTIDPMPPGAQGAAMSPLVRFVLAAALLGPPSALSQAAWAQVQPHRAEYALRLGPAINAPRIGTAIQDLTQDCGGWHLKRDIATEIAAFKQWVAVNLGCAAVIGMLEDDVLSKSKGLTFFQKNNPIVRHVVLRRRETLEREGLIPRTGMGG